MIIRDGDWTLVSADLKLGRQVWSRQNPDGSTTVRTDYKVDEVLDANQAARSAAQGTRFGDWARVASIPLNVYYGNGLADAQEQLDGKYFDKWLSENSKFKTR
jgi:hypothetical protein